MFGLFRKKPVLDPKHIEQIVRMYGGVIEGRTGSVRSETELPFEKRLIETALIAAIELTPEGGDRQHLRNGYLFLADFQDLTPEEMAKVALYNAALTQESDDSEEDAQRRALIFQETGPVATRVNEKVLAEMGSRMHDLEKRGLAKS